MFLQVNVSVLGVGPKNLKLNGSYRTVDTFQYQDELGDLVLRICHEMPYGVLVFFPSYRLLEKLSERYVHCRLMSKCIDVNE